MKIKVTYSEAEKPMFERVRAELIQTVPYLRIHESTAPGGLHVWSMRIDKKKELS